MDDNDTTPKTDAAETEEVTSETTDTSDGDSQATVLLSLEELVKSHITSIDKLTDELKKYRQMFADGFENNPTYRELEEQAKDAAKKKNTAREEILKQPSMQDLGRKIKDANTLDVKMIRVRKRNLVFIGIRIRDECAKAN